MTRQFPKPSSSEAGLLIVLALIALALNLRGPLTAIPPVIAELRADLGVGPVVIGLLTTIPVLCFGLLTPLASVVIARTTIEASIFVTLVGVGLGTLIRAMGGIEIALLGTLILGTAATLGNIVSLLVIARDFPRNSPLITGIYASSLNAGTMLTSASTAPLAALFGWRIAIGCWALLAVLAIILWAVAFARHQGTAPLQQIAGETVPEASLIFDPKARQRAPETSLARPVWRRPLVWLLALAFGTHVFMYYALTAWLPAFLMQTEAMTPSEAGLAASLFQIMALLGSFGVPAMAGRLASPLLLIGVGLAWLVTPIGLLAAPGLWFVWAVLGGAATGGGFTVTFMLVVEYAADLDDNRRISAMVQGIGYSIAAMGPVIVGALHQHSGGWTSSLMLLIGIALAVVTAAALIARRSAA